MNFVLKMSGILAQKLSRITNTLKCAHEFDLRTRRGFSVFRVFFFFEVTPHPHPLPNANNMLRLSDIIFGLLVPVHLFHRYRCCQISDGNMNVRNFVYLTVVVHALRVRFAFVVHFKVVSRCL